MHYLGQHAKRQDDNLLYHPACGIYISFDMPVILAVAL